MELLRVDQRDMYINQNFKLLELGVDTLL